MTSVPELYLDSASLPPGTAFATFQSILPSYRLGLGPGVTLETFEFSARAWLLGGLILSRTRDSAMSVSRTPELIKSDNNDSYSFFSFTSGSWAGDFGGRPITVGPGQIVGFDLSKPFEAMSTDHSTFSLVVARSLLSEPFRDAPDLHGHVFEGVAAEMLLDHMLSVERWIPSIREGDIAAVVKATLGIVNALLTSVPKREDIEPSALASQHEIRRFIETHLHELDLTPERIAREMSVARSTLFRSFKPLGGVAAHVRRRRLEVIRVRLLDPAETRSITDLALTFGFASPSHFAVAFKKAFGRSAREVRNRASCAQLAAPEADNRDVPSAYRAWTRSLMLR